MKCIDVILAEANNNRRDRITGVRKFSRNGNPIAQQSQIERHKREDAKRQKKKKKAEEQRRKVEARKNNQIDESPKTLIDFLNESVEISKYDLLPTMMKAMKELQKELSDYKKVGDSAKIAEINANIQDLNNKIIRKKQGR